jgi:hypothetical protein
VCAADLEIGEAKLGLPAGLDTCATFTSSASVGRNTFSCK